MAQGGAQLAPAQAPGPMPTTMMALVRSDPRQARHETALRGGNLRPPGEVRPGPDRIRTHPDAAPDLASRLANVCNVWTGQRWGISVVGSGGGATLAQEQDRTSNAARGWRMENPVVQAVFAAFPAADHPGPHLPTWRNAAEAEALAPVEDEWDPFEED
jgi:DNA polymerase III subunit gamma/tau